MRIVFVDSGQFDLLWQRMVPAQRMTGNLPTPAIVLQHLNTLVLLKEEIQFADAADLALDKDVSVMKTFGTFVRDPETEWKAA